MIELSSYVRERNLRSGIVEVYLSHLQELSIEKRQHFAVRAENAGLCDLSVMEEALSEYSDTVNQAIVQFCDGNYKAITKELAATYKSSPSRRKKDIGEYFSEMVGKPEVCKILALYRIAEMVDIFIRTGNIDLIDMVGFNQCYTETIDSIEEFMSGDTFFADHFSKAIVTYTNLWWYLRNYSDNRSLNPSGRKPNRKIMDSVREWLSEAYTETKGDLESILYGVTHVIIGATRFYTRKLSSDYIPEIQLIADAIQKHFYTEDLNLEMALCLKLSDMPEYQSLVRKAVMGVTLMDVDGKQIVQNFPIRGDMVKDLSRNEHTNSLYLMCCV